MEASNVSEVRVPVANSKGEAASVWPGILGASLSFARNFKQFWLPSTGTPLRVLSLMAMDDAAWRHGRKLDATQRETIIRLMELGAHLNDHFDGERMDREALRNQARWLLASEHDDTLSQYVRALWRIERSRPLPNSTCEAITAYRIDVLRVSLAALWSVSSEQSFERAWDQFGTDRGLSLLLQFVILSQVIDDLWDAHDDLQLGLPSFVSMQDAKTGMEQVIAQNSGGTLRWDQFTHLQLAVQAAKFTAKALLRVTSLRFGTNHRSCE